MYLVGDLLRKYLVDSLLRFMYVILNLFFVCGQMLRQRLRLTQADGELRVGVPPSGMDVRVRKGSLPCSSALGLKHGIPGGST